MTSELPGIRYDGFHRANTATLSIARKCSENQIVGFLSLCFIRSCCTYIFPQIDLKKKKNLPEVSVATLLLKGGQGISPQTEKIEGKVIRPFSEHI